MILQENVPLAAFTTFQIGGPARFFVEAVSVEDVIEALAFARERSLPVFTLGGGSNVLITDDGFDGLVLAMRIKDIAEKKQGDSTLVTAGSGVVWDDFVQWTIERDLKGLECMSGVPSTVGGAVVSNLGAYGAQVSDTLVDAEVIDTTDVRCKVQV